MFNIDLLKNLLLISIALSTITCTLIQKTKGFLPNSKWITFYSLIINLVIGIFFCLTFTSLSLENSLWIGFFSFLGADSIYKALEGKISSYTDILDRKNISIKKENIINREED